MNGIACPAIPPVPPERTACSIWTRVSCEVDQRLRDWHEAGVRQRPHEGLLAELDAANALDRSRW
ncbi:hypothetical protein [Saccharothrix syringae]|uniref:hypothetical protein n=1 Tax=Saccharothrix syringae TaxID=103733 RepID=UPI000AF526F3